MNFKPHPITIDNTIAIMRALLGSDISRLGNKPVALQNVTDSNNNNKYKDMKFSNLYAFNI